MQAWRWRKLSSFVYCKFVRIAWLELDWPNEIYFMIIVILSRPPSIVHGTKRTHKLYQNQHQYAVPIKSNKKSSKDKIIHFKFEVSKSNEKKSQQKSIDTAARMPWEKISVFVLYWILHYMYWIALSYNIHSKTTNEKQNFF